MASGLALSCQLALASVTLGLRGGLIFASAKPLLPTDSYCYNASHRFERSKGAASEALDTLECESAVICCAVDDANAVFEQLQHSMDFGFRNLNDRKDFYAQLQGHSLGQHPCAAAGDSLVSMRVQVLGVLHEISERIIKLMETTVLHMLRAACCGRPEPSEELEQSLGEEWSKLSQEVLQWKDEVRAHDGSVAQKVREAGFDVCFPRFVGALLEGSPVPSSRTMPLRPWTTPGKGITGFQEVWKRWIEALFALSIELAEEIQTEVQGILLAFGHMANDQGPGFSLLVEPPAPAEVLPSLKSTSVPSLVQPFAALTPSHGTSQFTVSRDTLLLVRFPNPETNLRFDFANDPAMLNPMALAAHVAALNPLTTSSRCVLVLVTANPGEAATLKKEFAGQAHVHVVWRRFALYQPDDLAAVAAQALLTKNMGGDGGTTRLISVFEVPSGGDAAGLAQAVKQISGGAGFSPLMPAIPAFRIARASHWLKELNQPRATAGGMAEQTDDTRCSPMVGILKKYLTYHAEVVARLRQGAAAPQEQDRLLIYRCSALGFCGGHGDRLNGLLGVFALALASNRAFFIDSARPVHLHLVLKPRRRSKACSKAKGDLLLDWRISSAVGAVGRRTNYNDRHQDIIADLPWLLSGESENVVVMHSNQRTTIEVLESEMAMARLGDVARELLAMPFLHAELLELLFEPTPLLAVRFATVSRAARNGRPKLLGVHFRAGNRSPKRWNDPPRHGLAEFEAFLSCAVSLEKALGWRDEDVAFYVATDTTEVESLPSFQDLRRRGKLAFLPAGHQDASIIHLDRSQISLAVEGVVDTWAQWLTLAASDAAVLSASNFGVLAAEAGRLRTAFLGAQGCIPMDVIAA